jgi:hypothetical protein
METPAFAVPRPAKPEIPSRPPPTPEIPPQRSPGPEILPRPGYPSPGQTPVPDMPPPPPGEAPRDAFGRSLRLHGPLRPTRSHLPTANDRRAAFRVLTSEGARQQPAPRPVKEPIMLDNPQTTQTTEATPHPIEKSAIEARQGVTPGVVRWVLALSLAGAIVAMAVVYAVMRGG